LCLRRKVACKLRLLVRRLWCSWPNDPAQQRRGTGELWSRKTNHAPPSAAAPGSASDASRSKALAANQACSTRMAPVACSPQWWRNPNPHSHTAAARRPLAVGDGFRREPLDRIHPEALRRRTTKLTCPAGAAEATNLEKPTCHRRLLQRLVRRAFRADLSTHDDTHGGHRPTIASHCPKSQYWRRPARRGSRGDLFGLPNGEQGRRALHE